MAKMNNYLSLNEIKVGLNFGEITIPVGRLASRNSKIYFEYDETFLDMGLDISPLRLPLESGSNFQPEPLRRITRCFQ